MNKSAGKAWELYLKMDTSSESYQLLLLLANDCYKTHQYFTSFKAFDALERLDPNSSENFDGKRASLLALLQRFTTDSTTVNGEAEGQLRDILAILRDTRHPQMIALARIIRSLAKDYGVSLV